MITPTILAKILKNDYIDIWYDERERLHWFPDLEIVKVGTLIRVTCSDGKRYFCKVKRVEKGERHRKIILKEISS